MTCPAFDPIRRDGSRGWCHAVEHRVYHKDGLLCLCDFCTAEPDGQHRISADVTFVGNDIIELKSARASRLATAIEHAATIQCAPKIPPKAPPAATSAAPKAKKAPVPARKPGLLGFA
jgi:hypothetical protein